MELWDLGDLCTPWCLHVVATLRIADLMASGITNVNRLAEDSRTDPQSLDRVLRHLAGKGVFQRTAPGHYEMNPLARGLLDDGVRLGFDLEGIGGRMAHAWGTLLSAVRSGKPAGEAFGREFWDDLAAHPQVAASLDDLMGPAGHGIPDPEILPDPSAWDSVTTVVDVGGGTGSLLAEILRSRPHLRGVLVDLPRTVARSGATFQAAGVEDRVSAVGQSFFDPLPPGASVYVLRSVLADWPDRDAAAILRRCAEAASPAGRVIVFNRAGPGEETPYPDLLMLVLVGGKERTIEELRKLGHEAGLEIRSTGRQASGRVLVEFRPA